MPNIQLDQLGSEELYEVLKARFYALPDVEERQTTVSDPRARAMWLRDGVPAGDPDAFMGNREFGHFHPSSPVPPVVALFSGIVRSGAGLSVELERPWRQRLAA